MKTLLSVILCAIALFSSALAGPDLKAEREAQCEANSKALWENVARENAAEHAAAWNTPNVITTTISEITPGTWKGISSDGTSYTINSYPDLGTVHVTAVH